MSSLVCFAALTHEILKDKIHIHAQACNNNTIILLNLAEYRLILADSAYGLVG